MHKKDNSKPPMSKNERKRGRPAGKNRVPLSLAERRARNAQYERERRNETADAMAQLAEAACCDPQITNPDLLATVINRLQNSQCEKSLEDLKRINEDLEAQIAELEKQLAEDPPVEEYEVENSECRTTSRSDSSSVQSNDRRPTKFRKTFKRCRVHDGAKPTRRSSNQSSDSQDSNWSNHHFGKTLPTGMITEQLQKNETNSDQTSSRFERIQSTSSDETHYSNEVYSDCSNQPETFYDESRPEVRVDFQFLPEVTQLETESYGVEEQRTDPFTDQEKAILANLGWSDFLQYQEPYTENQLMWPQMDYASF